MAVGSAATSLFDFNGSPSYTVSTCMAISTIGGTTTTVVIQSTVGTQQHQSSHGPPQGTIPGAVVGGAVFLPLLVGVGLWWRIRRRCNRVRSLKGTSNPDLGATDQATRWTPATTESVHRAGSLANPSSDSLAVDEAREPLHHDAVSIAASLSCSQGNSGPQSTAAPPPPPSYSLPEPSADLDDSLLRSDNAAVALAEPRAILTSTDLKPDPAPGRISPPPRLPRMKARHELLLQRPEARVTSCWLVQGRGSCGLRDMAACALPEAAVARRARGGR